MMTANPAHPDDMPPQPASPVRILNYAFAALFLFYAFALVSGALPDAVVEITGSVLMAAVLTSIAARWIGWIRAGSGRPSAGRRVVTTVISALLVYILFRETWFDPLPGMVGSILSLSFFPLVLGSLIWSVARVRDEVCRASAYESFAWGSLVGVGLTYAGIVVLRFSPAIADALQAKAATMAAAPGGLPPAAVGFAFGAAFGLVSVWMSLFIAWALWWRRMR